jgi:hypothetical protein
MSGDDSEHVSFQLNHITDSAGETEAESIIIFMIMLYEAVAAPVLVKEKSSRAVDRESVV